MEHYGDRPTHLDLFSGIGGFALAAQRAGFRTIGFCEIDKYCQKVLAKNFLADAATPQRHRSTGEGLPGTGRASERSCGFMPKIFGNIFDLDGREFPGVDLITGGFPCQPFSVAGKRRGAADDRAIWPEMFRVISEARPAWVLGENVPGIISLGEFDNVPPVDSDGHPIGNLGDIYARRGPGHLRTILDDLGKIGYETIQFVIPACAVDARHRRDRLWIIGRLVVDSAIGGLACGTDESGCAFRIGGFAAKQPRLAISSEIESELRGTEWLPEPNVGRVAHGVPSRVDRLKGLGNAIVPQVAYEILKEIRKLC